MNWISFFLLNKVKLKKIFIYNFLQNKIHILDNGKKIQQMWKSKHAFTKALNILISIWILKS